MFLLKQEILKADIKYIQPKLLSEKIKFTEKK